MVRMRDPGRVCGVDGDVPAERPTHAVQNLAANCRSNHVRSADIGGFSMVRLQSVGDACFGMIREC